MTSDKRFSSHPLLTPLILTPPPPLYLVGVATMSLSGLNVRRWGRWQRVAVCAYAAFALTLLFISLAGASSLHTSSGAPPASQHGTISTGVRSPEHPVAALTPELSNKTNGASVSPASSAGLMLSLSRIIVPEGSSSAYTVRLAAAPSADVTVTVSATGDSDITADTDPDTAGDQSTLTFTSTDWSVPQTVALNAAEETGNADKVYGAATVTHTTASSDNSYSSLTATLAVTEGDNDVCPGTAAVGGSGVTTDGLVDDCNTLLAAKAVLAGTSTAIDDWATTTPIANWEGINTATDPATGKPRVSGISLYLLGSNQLTGVLPNTLGNLVHLTRLRIGSGLSGPIPAQLGNLTGLTYLFLYGKSLSGPIPAQLGNLTGLAELVLGGNLSGPIPAQLGNLTGLTTRLWLGGNSLTSIPAQLGNLTNLKKLYLHGNSLTSIPPEIGNLTELTYLNLHSNSLTSIPPEIGNLTELTYLNLHSNSLTSIPAQLGNLTELTYLYLQHNSLTSIPPQLGNLSDLILLYLFHNDLSGQIPPELGNLDNLITLGLEHNDLSGQIPSELGNLDSLITLGLGHNDLSGQIPSELGNLDSLITLGLGHNDLSGQIPPELGNLTDIEGVYLSHNDLSGQIPSELGNLGNLQILNLSHNDLSGQVPPELGNLTELRHLYLGENGLSDCVPSNLVGLLSDINPQSGSVYLAVCDGVVVSEARVSVPEGSTADYTVRLATEPEANVEVTLALKVGGDGDLTITAEDCANGTTGTQLCFTADDYSTPQTVTVNAVADTDNTDGTATITHTTVSTDGDYNSLTATVTAIEADNDPSLTASAFTHDSAMLTLAGHTAGWYYKRTTPTIGTCSSEVAASTTTADLTGLAASMSYAYTAYSDSSCTVVLDSAAFTTMPPSLTASAFTHDSAMLTLAGHTAGWYYKRTTPTIGTCSSEVAASTTTADLTGLAASMSYAYTAYSDSSCTVVLDSAAFTTMPPSLTASAFTHDSAMLTLAGHTSAWHYKHSQPPGGTCQPQVPTGTSSVNLTGLTPGTAYTYTAYSDSGCSAAVTQAPLTFTTRRVIVTPENLQLSAGGTGIYTLQLAAQPSEAITITTAVSSSGIITVDTSSDTGTQSTLTFTTTDWNTAQTVTVAATDDSRGGTVAITHTPVSSSDADYHLTPTAPVVVVVTSRKTTQPVLPLLPPPAPPAPIPKQTLPAVPVFTDIDGSVHEADILKIAAVGITRGCAPRLFCPYVPVSRAQMAAFLARALKLSTSAVGSFTDIDGSVHEADILKIAAVGITRGCAPRLFCPDGPVTRAQMAAFLARARGLSTSAVGGFTDIDGSVHEADILKIAAVGITRGCAPRLFCPYVPVSRAQMAAFLARALGL